MTPKEVFELIKEKDVKFVDLRFTDTRGKEQHVSVPTNVLRTGQVRVRSLLRRFLDRRMEGHSGFGHGAAARSDFVLHRSVPGHRPRWRSPATSSNLPTARAMTAIRVPSQSVALSI